MQSMAHELEKEGFQICGGIGVSRERYKEKNNYSWDLAGSIGF
jgi:hypothetical protein